MNGSFESGHKFDIDCENYSANTNEWEDNLNSNSGRNRMGLLTNYEDAMMKAMNGKLL